MSEIAKAFHYVDTEIDHLRSTILKEAEYPMFAISMISKAKRSLDEARKSVGVEA